MVTSRRLHSPPSTSSSSKQSRMPCGIWGVSVAQQLQAQTSCTREPRIIGSTNLDDCFRGACLLQALFAQAVFVAAAGIDSRRRLAAEKDQTLGEDGKPRDGAGASCLHDGVGNDAVIVGDVHGVVPGRVGNRVELDGDVHELDKPRLCADRLVERTLRLDG